MLLMAWLAVPIGVAGLTLMASAVGEMLRPSLPSRPELRRGPLTPLPVRWWRRCPECGEPDFHRRGCLRAGT